MQWRKLARSKISSGRSRTRKMLCCGRRKDNGREALDLTASPLRAPPSQPPNNRPPGHPPPMVIQGDFRKVSGISSEIFKQIETVENDHDASTAAALEHVERRGEMIVRILDARHLGRSAGDQAKRFLGMQDGKHTVQFVEIVKRPGQTLGLYIREGNGQDRSDGVFISRIALESAVYNSGCLKVGDEILAVNLVDVTRMSLDDVVIIMSIPRRLVLATRQRKGGAQAAGGRAGAAGAAPAAARPEHKPPPVVVIKRDLRDDDQDDADSGPAASDQHRESIRQRHTGDGREMSESRSRLGLGLSTLDRQAQMDRHGGGQQPDTNGLDLYYNRAAETCSWGYQPPPPVVTEQPKPGGGAGGGAGPPHFQQYERAYPNTLESLAEKVHSFGMTRRMSAGGQPMSTRLSSGQTGYYTQRGGDRRAMPRSGSDQHLPRTEYASPADYTSITQAGRHSLLRSSLKSGSTLSRYNQRFVDQAAVAAQLAQAKYGTSGQYGTSGTMRRNRGSLDYSSDTEATVGSRAGYYYYRDRSSAAAAAAAAAPHSTIPTLGRQNSLTPATDMSTKFNSLPRDSRGASRLAMNKRFGDRGLSGLLQDDTDGALSAPEMPSSIRRDRDEYRQWLSRTPSTSAIYEQIRASRDVLNQQRAARFTYSAENIHDALKNMESGLYSSYGRPGTTSTLDRHFTRSQQPSIPARSLSTQHITSSSTALSSSRSPSMRRMRQLLDLDSVRTGAPSPVPTPSGTLPRGQRQLDINPAEFLKYKIDRPGGGTISGGTSLTGLSQLAAGGSLTGPGGPAGDEPVSGMLWVHLLAGRGLRATAGTSTATTPVTPSGGAPTITGSTGLRDLYCVLECDRVHKARTVVRTGDLVFDWDESFELDLVNNRELDLLIYSWDPQYRHKLCYKGSVYLPTLLRQGPVHQLALKIEPRGTLYLRLRHTDSHTLYRRRSLSTLTLTRTTPLFGVDLETVVNRENKTGGVPGGVATGLVTGTQQNIPIIIRRCVEEVERRGLDIIGLYRLCGSATKKRVLRDAFERNSRSVDLSPDNVPDINVITGVLKDYLRELPEPLFTKCLYQMVVDALAVCLPDDPDGNAKLMFSILDCLPRINRATLIFLMDHLALVVSASDRNKMSAQNLATALAPPLMLQPGGDGPEGGATPQAPPGPQPRAPPLDYQQPIGVLKYLLQIWPTPPHGHSDRSARQASRAAWRQSQCVASGGGARAVSALSGSVSSSSSLSSLGPGAARPTATGPITPDTRSPSSSSDSQSGSDSVKHCLPGRVSSPAAAARASPSPLRSALAGTGPQGAGALRNGPALGPPPAMRNSPSLSSPGGALRNSPSLSSPGGALRNSPSMGSSPMRASPSPGLVSQAWPSPAGTPRGPSAMGRASPSLLGQPGSRSSSPAMQASSAGLNVTMSTSFASLGMQGTAGAAGVSTTAAGTMMGYTAYTPTYASTNPFLTGAYMSNDTNNSYSGEKYNTIGWTKEIKSFFENYSSEATKYSTLSTRSSYDTTTSYSTPDTKFNTVGWKFSPSKNGGYERKDQDYDGPKSSGYESAGQRAEPSASDGLLHVEDTPTPTSSIETEDSNTREVGERDVEGDGEQSD